MNSTLRRTHSAVPDAARAATLAAWDSYLRSTPLGQFQQSSSWANAKALDGWSSLLLLVDDASPEMGGLQLLWKPTRLGRIGYVSKGPVLPLEEPRHVRLLLQRLRATARELRLRALILQPPDESRISAEDLVEHGFFPGAVPSVIRCTAVAPLDGGPDAVRTRMNRQARREARLARERGVELKTGSREDLRCFHQLMTLSAARQGSPPNPSRPDILERWWDEFRPHLHLRLALFGSETIAGLLMIGHGRRLTFWKKGWNPNAARVHANCLLNADTLGWASAQGYGIVDFAGMDPGIAEALVSGRPLSEAQRQSRDMFNLRLGAKPKLVPPAQLLILNSAARRLFEVMRFCPHLQKQILQRALSAA